VAKYLATPNLRGGAVPVSFGNESGGRDSVLFGRLYEQGAIREVRMDISAESVIAIFGKRGSGKSYTLGVLAEALASGPGTSDIGTNSGTKSAVLFDTLNVFWSLANPIQSETELARFSVEAASLRAWTLKAPNLNVDVWIPKGFRQPHTPQSYRDLTIAPKNVAIDDLLDLFELDPNSDPTGQLIGEACEKAESRGAFTYEDVLAVLEADPTVTGVYADSTIRAARQRVRSLSRLELFSSSEGTPLQEILRRGHVSVIELGEVPSSLRAVIAAVLLRQIHAGRARASDAEKQLALNARLSPSEKERLGDFLAASLPPTWVLIDEAQNVLPSDRQIKSSDAVLRFVREGRNFGLSLALTTQQPAAVDQRILAQADTIICHKLTVAGDIAKMRDNLKSAEPTEVKIGGQVFDLPAWLRSLEPGIALVTNTESERVFALQVRPRTTPHGGTGFRVDVDS